MSKILLKEIGKSYDNSDKKVIDSLNLEIKDEEFLVLVGPSGCGKTTVLRMIAGLEDISSGELYIDDKVVNDLEPKDRDIAMVFQNYALYPHLSVFGNIAYPLKQRKMKQVVDGKEVLRKYSKQEIQEKVEEIAELLNVSQLLKRKPKALSGGERQRVALARAMVRNPKVFLMDEPLSNLDAQLRTQTRGEILKLHKKIKTTFIYVTHDQTEALTMGDRIVVMNKGEIQQIDTPYEVFHNPANTFVAKFIGSPAMNFLNGFIKEDKIEVPELGFKFGLSREVAQDVTIGIRPEYIRIVDNKSDGIEMDVDYSELMGTDTILHLFKNGIEICCKVPTESYKNEKKVYIEFVLKYIHFFDKETGKLKDNITPIKIENI